PTSRFHDIMANSVTRHPCNLVFSHGRDVIGERHGSQVTARSSYLGLPRLMKRTKIPKSHRFLPLRAKPGCHQIFGTTPALTARDRVLFLHLRYTVGELLYVMNII